MKDRFAAQRAYIITSKDNVAMTSGPRPSGLRTRRHW